MDKKTTLIVVGVDTLTPEEAENDRLRNYAKSSGPAGVGMANDRPEDSKEETFMEMAKRYGSNIADVHSGTMDALFGETPPYRIREPSIAPMDTDVTITPGADGESFTMMIPTSGSGTIDPSILNEVKSIDDTHGRDPDMVLMDWMGDEDKVDSDYLSDLYPSDERIDYLSRRAGGETLIPVRPDSVRQMSDDMRDYNRFGGDAVSMELDRRVSEERVESDDDHDAMLRALMAGNVEYSGIQDSSEGLSALREDLGNDVEVNLLGKDGTKTTYSAYSPRFGRIKYSYDSISGIGRILEQQ